MSIDTDNVAEVYAVTETMNIVENAGCLARTNIATHHFTNIERLIFAIYDDDSKTFDKMGIPLEDLAKLELDDGANVLNVAID